MAMLAGLSVQHFSPEQNISIMIWFIPIKCEADINGPLRINPKDLST